MTQQQHPGTSQRPGQMTAVMRAVAANAGPKVLRIGVVQGGRVAEERIIKQRIHVTVGASEKNMFVLATSSVPASFRVFELVGNDYHLNFLDGMTGRIALPTGISDLSVLKGLYAAHKEIQLVIKDTNKNPWNDVRVRQAMNHAINRQDIIDKVFGGDAAYSSIIPPGYGDWPLAEADLKGNYLKYDVDKAKSLLQQAGLGSGHAPLRGSRPYPISGRCDRSATALAPGLSSSGTARRFSRWGIV